MLAGRHGAGRFVGHPLEIGAAEGAEDGAVGVGQGGQHWLAAGEAGAVGAAIGGRVHQFGLAAVPLLEQLVGGGAADQAGVGDAGETHAGDVAGGGVDPFKIPDRLGGLWEVVGEKAAAIFLGEDTGKSPFVAPQRTHIQDVDHQDVAGLGTIHPDRPAQHVNHLQVHIGDVLGVVVVLDLAIRPVFALDPEHISGVDGGHGRNVRVPAVMTWHFLLIHRLGQINLEKCFWHGQTSGHWGIKRQPQRNRK